MSTTRFTPEQLADFERDGFVIQRGLLDAEEAAILRDYAKNDPALLGDASSRKDAEGRATLLRLWNEPSDEPYGILARMPRIVDRVEQVLGGEAYHYHSKMSLKQPRVGGAWEWHQDYGYWYDFGCLYPLLVSVMTAIDRSNRDNGCLQVLVGSHKIGRINHGPIGDQTGADPEHVEAACTRHELAYVELEPGDAVFFHCNLLHRSDDNRSEHPRWTLICCYNARRNDPYKASRHPSYAPLERVTETALREWRDAAPAGA
ncbi:MAG: phytanoyl-CoA dioxygenase family protein [Planctomycetales bacterium]|nr:phytanoyl-CoA dioxygenase family protein [Planctomycetales bacterium]